MLNAKQRSCECQFFKVLDLTLLGNQAWVFHVRGWPPNYLIFWLVLINQSLLQWLLLLVQPWIIICVSEKLLQIKRRTSDLIFLNHAGQWSLVVYMLCYGNYATVICYGNYATVISCLLTVIKAHDAKNVICSRSKHFEAYSKCHWEFLSKILDKKKH